MTASEQIIDLSVTSKARKYLMASSVTSTFCNGSKLRILLRRLEIPLLYPLLVLQSPSHSCRFPAVNHQRLRVLAFDGPASALWLLYVDTLTLLKESETRPTICCSSESFSTPEAASVPSSSLAPFITSCNVCYCTREPTSFL